MAYQLLRLCTLAVVLGALVVGNPIDSPSEPLPAPAGPVSASSTAVPPSTPAADVASSTEGSKMSRFLDDFTSAFKQGTAKMKESLESAATSVKDGVLQGYDYVRSKLTGAGNEGTPAATGEDSSEQNATTAALTSTAPSEAGPTSTSSAPSTERPATAGAGSHASPSLPAYGGAVGVSNEPAKIVPNDEDDDERIIFNDKDYLAEKSPEGEDEREVTETPATTGVTIDNRFIFASPIACKSGQEVVNGKCRNVF